MKALRGWIPAGILAAVLMFGSTVANAGTGIIIGGAGYTDPGDPCSGQTSGVNQLLSAATGIIIGGAGYTGIIVVDNSSSTTACGIIIGGAS